MLAMPLQAGRNCWKIKRARRLSVLIDAQSYYSAFYSALRQAKRTVTIIAWDIDTRVVLQYGGASHGRRVSLGDAILETLTENPRLEVFILCWDFAMMYALEREVFPQFRRAFRHPRIHFVLDSIHPFGASQHQKIIVIDDNLAFTGGLDLCLRRWDTRHHHLSDPRRVDNNGREYAPFHDVQIVLSGDAATSLSELAKDRWWKVTGERLPDIATEGEPLWPVAVTPDFENIPVGISRTYFASSELIPNIREIETLFLDSIRSARNYVYIENQYFTAGLVSDAICDRLLGPESPEFLVIIPRNNSGWIEESTMGVLRSRLIRKMRSLDRFQRLRFYFPIVRSGESGHAVAVSLHSKIMVVDDHLLHTGSANLSNRSMGLDTECDIAVEAENYSTVSRAIAGIRNSLLAEHLGSTESEVETIVSRYRSLFEVVDRIGLGPGKESHRCLVSFPNSIDPWRDRLTPDAGILDPDRPVEYDSFFSKFIPRSKPEFLELKDKRLKTRILFALSSSALLSLPAIRGALARLFFTDTFRHLRIILQKQVRSIGFFFTGLSLQLPADVLAFAACLVTPLRSGAFASFRGLFFTSMIYYGLGKASTMAQFNSSESAEGTDLKNAPHGGFWGNFLLHMNLMAPLPVISFRAGRYGARLGPFTAGTLGGNLIRIFLTGIYAKTYRRILGKPTVFNFCLFLSATSFILIAFRWSSHRFLPSYGQSPVQKARGLRIGLAKHRGARDNLS